ncbi:MAG TPA: hypothetical protein VLH79_13940, partial [Chthonomonadales bacterium]|nr:hypothetical protein [Chthonomonadales bacterium]
PAAPSRRAFVGALASAAAGLAPATAAARQAFPPLPRLVIGINQYNVGHPHDLGRYWPPTDAELERLRADIGLNVVRFPLYPWELGFDGEWLCTWKPGDVFDPAEADRRGLDWRSLDTILGQIARLRMTPYICPVAEGRTWPTKQWMNLHLPESYARTAWFTRRVVEHVQKLYGDRVIYGWYENWYWNTGTSLERADQRFLQDWRRTLAGLYGGRIGALNRAWGASYRTFDEVALPVLFRDGNVPEDAYDSRRTYDLRLAVDLIHRRNLASIRDAVKAISPGAVFAGGSLCNELGGLYDTRSVRPVRLNGTIRTHAVVCDVVASSVYGRPAFLRANHRTVAKIADSQRRRMLTAEVSAARPEALQAIADTGGPTWGVCVWAGKEDAHGLIAFDGTRREYRIRAADGLRKAYEAEPERYARYRRGRILVYFPEETWNYSITRLNHAEAYDHLYDDLPPEQIEPVLTAELRSLPRNAPILVLEKTLPAVAIAELNRRGRHVICPHRRFVDESGRVRPRPAPLQDFRAQLRAVRDGGRLLDACLRVVEKEGNLAYRWLGAVVRSASRLAEKNLVLQDRPNTLGNLIDGSVFDGVTLADAQQREVIDIELPRMTTLAGAFVQLYAGDGQFVGPSRVPERWRVLVSEDGASFRQVAETTSGGRLRLRASFAPCEARVARLDLGENASGPGLRIVETGLLGHPPPRGA